MREMYREREREKKRERKREREKEREREREEEEEIVVIIIVVLVLVQVVEMRELMEVVDPTGDPSPAERITNNLGHYRTFWSRDHTLKPLFWKR